MRARRAGAFGSEEMPTGFKEYWADPTIKPMGMTAYYDVAKKAYAAGFKAGLAARDGSSEGIQNGLARLSSRERASASQVGEVADHLVPSSAHHKRGKP